MTQEVSLIILIGGGGKSPPEIMVQKAREAVTLDTIEKAKGIKEIGQIIVATDSLELAQRLRGEPIVVELDKKGEEFHFGRRLRDIISQHHIEKPFYMGGGSGPLLDQMEMRMVVEAVLSTDRIMVSNNFYSTDFVAFSPGEAVNSIEPPAFDNNLCWLLKEAEELPSIVLPRTAGTQVDVDIPTDLMILSLHPAIGKELRRYLDTLQLDLSHIRQAMVFLTNPEREIFLAGRVSGTVWDYLGKQTACRVRLLSEERGMRASGRLERSEARSLLGYCLEAMGVERFFTVLGGLGDAAFIDTRVILAHFRLWPPPEERFYSDLRQPEKISLPFLREFTAAAKEAPIPVVLGGHSLVSGGLCALTEAAWEEFDARQEMKNESRRA